MPRMPDLVSQSFAWFRHSFTDPAWVAAWALSLQVLIFGVQAWIFSRHAATFEAQKEVAKQQAATAKAIQERLQQQEEVLKSQFSIQKQLVAQSERRLVFDLMTKLLVAVYGLEKKLAKVSQITDEVDKALREAYIRVGSDATICRMALLSTEFLSQQELDYFTRYLGEASDLKQSNAPNHADYIQVKDFQKRYENFWQVVADNRKAAIAETASGTPATGSTAPASPEIPA